MTSFHLFTLAGIPVSVSPWYFLLLWSFMRGDALSAVIWAACITAGLLVHELGHALVARRLRHAPSILLHGFGGLTLRQRQGRDVEEALIIAMGPAAGLALGLLAAGVWLALAHSALWPAVARGPFAVALHALLWPGIVWNVFNLLPVWPLDGGQLFRLGVMRKLGARRADAITHGLSLLLLGALALPALAGGQPFLIVILVLLALQNVSALRGRTSAGILHTSSRHAADLVAQAQQALDAQQYREAARLAQQARAQTNVPPPLLDEIWELLGVCATALGEHEEALSYLRRARPTARVRHAAGHCLRELGRVDELRELQARWQIDSPGRYAHRWLAAVLVFLGAALTAVFATPIASMVF